MQHTASTNAILQYAEQEYIERGHAYSGAIGAGDPYDLHRTGLTAGEYRQALEALVTDGWLILRGSQRETYKLAASHRVGLIEDHGLSRVWQEKASFDYPNDPRHGEVPQAYRELAEA